MDELWVLSRLAALGKEVLNCDRDPAYFALQTLFQEQGGLIEPMPVYSGLYLHGMKKSGRSLGREVTGCPWQKGAASCPAQGSVEY